jgi:hypothetical protein
MMLCLLVAGISEAKKKKPKPAVNLTGTWNGVFETEEGDIPFTLVISQPPKSQTFNGVVSVTDPDSGAPISINGRGRVNKRGRFSWEGNVLIEGQNVHLEISGSVSGNQMSGDAELSSGGQQIAEAGFHATR